MKRSVLLLSIAIPCLAGLYYTAPYYVAARKSGDQNAANARVLAADGPLVLDARTQAIFSHANRVETFLLRNPNQNYDEQDMPALIGPRVRLLDGCEVRRVGLPQGHSFAIALRAALTQMPSPGNPYDQRLPKPDDFGSDVGFRVWQGDAHADIFVGLYSKDDEIVSKDASHKILMQTVGTLGASQPALLALSRQEFPQDKQLAALSASL